MGEIKLKQIKKRDGTVVSFNKIKIAEAIFKAVESVGGSDKARAEYLAEIVTNKLDAKYDGNIIPNVEDIQDLVEHELIEHGHASTAKAYILYRHQRNEERKIKKNLIGKEDILDLPLNSIKVLKQRYLLKDDSGKITESPKELFERVANNIASADKLYDENADLESTSKEFYELMSTLTFLPNSPTLMNAGNELQQLSGCFVLPVPDSIHGIFEGVKNAALIHKSGGGTGFSFSRLRPRNDTVMSTQGVSSGPISFMKVFNTATEVIKQGGKRRGANMGILRIDHPNILDFINCKEKESSFNNFNISVALTEKFMQAVENDEEYDLFNPRIKEISGQLMAKDVFNLIVTNAWKNGEPGIIFIDRINKDNPTPKIGEIESTNPCGEQPLLPYESCNLGSINLAKFIKNNEIDYKRLKSVVHTSIHFLDNVIDVNNYPLQEIAEMTRGNRKIGLGVMGFADMLLQLSIRYNSEEGVKLADEIMSFFKHEADNASKKLAEIRGNFTNIEKSIYIGQQIRNATRTTIAPTGSIGMIADTSNGIEPLFAISFAKHVMDGQKLLYVNKYFEKVAKERGFYSPELMEKIAETGSVQHIEEVPEDVKKVFVVAHDIDPEWHIKIQGAFQKHIDNAVSKTVNFRSDATTKDVEEAYMLAYKLGCKGITIYRDRSRDEQVINLDTSKYHKKKKKVEDKPEIKKEPEPEIVIEQKVEPKQNEEELCPHCKSKLYFSEGCCNCPSCGYSKCSI